MPPELAACKEEWEMTRCLLAVANATSRKTTERYPYPKSPNYTVTINGKFTTLSKPVAVALAVGQITVTEIVLVDSGQAETTHRCHHESCITPGQEPQKGKRCKANAMRAMFAGEDFCPEVSHGHCRYHAVREGTNELLGIPELRSDNHHGVDSPICPCGHRGCDYEAVDSLEVRRHWLLIHGAPSSFSNGPDTPPHTLRGSRMEDGSDVQLPPKSDPCFLALEAEVLCFVVTPPCAARV